MDLLRLTVFFSAKVAIIKPRSATIVFFSLSLSLLLLSYSSPFLFLRSFSFVTVMLELLRLKKHAFWRLFTQITANFVRLVFKKSVRCTLKEIWILPINFKKNIWRYNDARWRHCVNHVIHRNFWRLIFSIMSPKFDVKPNTQVKNTAKYAKYSWRERAYFIGDIISPSGVNKIRLIKPKQALNMSMHHPFLSMLLLLLFFFFNMSLPWGVASRLQRQ